MNNAENYKETCAVCGSASNTYSFGVFACQACVAFFRRSRGQTYQCRRDSNCDIMQKGQRTSCRSCRLGKCFEVGMTWDDRSTPGCASNAGLVTCSRSSVDDLPQQLPTAYVAVPAAPTPPPAVSNELLNKLLSDFKTLRHAQKSMHAMEHPDSVFGDIQYLPVTFAEYWRVESGTLSLIFSLLSETLDLCDVKEQIQKMEVLRDFTQKFGCIYDSLLCIEAFPDVGDQRLAVHYGGYVSADTLDCFFDETRNSELIKQFLLDPSEQARIMLPFMELRLKSIECMRRVQLREIEVAALAAVMLWKQLERSNLISAHGEGIRDRMFTDFHNEVVSHFGSAKAPARIVSVLGLVEDIVEDIACYRELKLMGKLFADIPLMDAERIAAELTRLHMSSC